MRSRLAQRIIALVAQQPQGRERLQRLVRGGQDVLGTGAIESVGQLPGDLLDGVLPVTQPPDRRHGGIEHVGAVGWRVSGKALGP